MFNQSRHTLILLAIVIIFISLFLFLITKTIYLKKTVDYLGARVEKIEDRHRLHSLDGLHKLIDSQIEIGEINYPISDGLKLEIAREMKFLISNDLAEEWIGRLIYYQGICDKIFRQHGIGKLWLLAGPESGFKFDAQSKAGAVGLYQLLPKTFTQLGGKIVWRHGKIIYDERLDFQINTRISVKYLLSLNRQFKNWVDAVSAYNFGPGAYQKTKNKQATNFEFLYLNHETDQYFVRYLAFYFICQNIGHLQLDIGQNIPLRWDEVTFMPHRPIELKEIMQWCASKNYRLIYRLNARFKDGTVHRRLVGYDQWTIRIPTNTKEEFIDNFQKNNAGKIL